MAFGFALILMALVVAVDAQGPPACTKEQIVHKFTQCDADLRRYRVNVPKESANCKVDEGVVMAPSCDFTCSEGEYLDIDGDQRCKSCEPGTFSLGGGMKISTWNAANLSPLKYQSLPADEDLDIEDVSKSFCNGSSVTSKSSDGEYLSILTSTKCFVELTLLAELQKSGRFELVYQLDQRSNRVYLDVSGNCKSRGSDLKVLHHTKKGQWRTIKLDMTKGVSSITLQLFHTSKSVGIRPFHIKSMFVSGLAYTTSCSKCPLGTYANSSSATECVECPMGTFAAVGATKCEPCPADKYSMKGSGHCLPRPACTADDYEEIPGICDKEMKTTVKYAWKKPQVCSSTAPGADALPMTKTEMCAKCNPGWFYESGKKSGECSICHNKEISDGGSPCHSCDTGFEPLTGVYLNLWLPAIRKSGVVTDDCVAVDDDMCADGNGWEYKDSYVVSKRNHKISASMVLVVDIAKTYDDTEVTFTFDMNCVGKCVLRLYLMAWEENAELDAHFVIADWIGQKKKQTVSKPVACTMKKCMLVFEFMKLTDEEISWTTDETKYGNNIARIYDVSLPKLVSGAAKECSPCLSGASKDNCLSCPIGTQLSNGTCSICPINFINKIGGTNPCEECGEGLITKGTKHDECTFGCQFEANGFYWDLSKFEGVKGVNGTKRFLPNSNAFFHSFNMSFCGNQYAKCYGMQQDLGDEEVSGRICRSTLFPLKSGSMYATHVTVLAEQLTNVSLKLPTNIQSEYEKTKLPNANELSVTGVPEIFLFLTSPDRRNSHCPDGRKTIVILRCSVEVDEFIYHFPPNCPDGTCDGCHYFILIKSKHACPSCQKLLFPKVKGECVLGRQTIFSNPPKHCMLLGANIGQTTELAKCSPVPFELQVFLIIVACFVLLLSMTLCYCWRRNRSLEVKYMKLAQTQDDKHILPSAETCGIDDDDEEDEESAYDRVYFKKSGGKHGFQNSQNMALLEED